MKDIMEKEEHGRKLDKTTSGMTGISRGLVAREPI
jgi:hypothetical protein